MKPAKKMKVDKAKKTTEPMKEKTGPKLKALRTSATKKKQKESYGKVVKSKQDFE